MSWMTSLAFEPIEFSPIAKIVIPFLGVLLITISMFMGIRKRHRRNKDLPSARDQVDELKQKRAVRGDLEELMVEIEQLAKRFGAQLDAKTMQMERLIDEADQKIAELNRLDQIRRDAPPAQPNQASSPKAQGSPPPEPPTPEPQPPAQTPDDVLKQSVYGLAEQGQSASDIARHLDEHVGKIELILALRKS